MELRYFIPSEFDSPDTDGSGELMDIDFLLMLDQARGLANIPFRINSGYRTESWNLKIGGRVGSSHVKGLAADIHCTNSVDRQKIISACIMAGFKRIGVAKTFIHVDSDNDKTDAIWLY
jgi:zinc D-Ala-D-Ala carboxypeptidase